MVKAVPAMNAAPSPAIWATSMAAHVATLLTGLVLGAGATVRRGLQNSTRHMWLRPLLYAGSPSALCHAHVWSYRDHDTQAQAHGSCC